MNDTNSLFLIDTNILVYAYEVDISAKKKKAIELVSKCLDGKINLVVSNQNLSEFAFVMIKKAKLSFSQANLNISDIVNFKGFIKINYSAKSITSALYIANKFGMSFWDSLIVATMKENNVFNIYTENTKDFKVHWINVVNPFL